MKPGVRLREDAINSTQNAQLNAVGRRHAELGGVLAFEFPASSSVFLIQPVAKAGDDFRQRRRGLISALDVIDSGRSVALSFHRNGVPRYTGGYRP